MDRKYVGQKTVRAFSMPDLILYNRTNRSWVVCPDFQGLFQWTGSNVHFSIRPVDISSLNLDIEETYPLETEMLDFSAKAMIRLFLRHLLNLANHSPQVAIIMSDFKSTSDPATVGQEEIEALMAESFCHAPFYREVTRQHSPKNAKHLTFNE